MKRTFPPTNEPRAYPTFLRVVPNVKFTKAGVLLINATESPWPLVPIVSISGRLTVLNEVIDDGEMLPLIAFNFGKLKVVSALHELGFIIFPTVNNSGRLKLVNAVQLEKVKLNPTTFRFGRLIVVKTALVKPPESEKLDPIVSSFGAFKVVKYWLLVIEKFTAIVFNSGTFNVTKEYRL